MGNSTIGDNVLNIEYIRPEPSDVVVITVSDKVRPAEKQHLFNYYKRMFPNNEVILKTADILITLNA